MTDQQDGWVPAGPDDPNYPSATFPTAFVDGVLSASWGRGVIKLYLSRTDPHFRAEPGWRDTPIAQIIAPVDGFASIALFLSGR